MLMTPPSALRPNRELCGPRTNSICEMSRNSMLDEFAFSCGTPSMYVVTPGFAGLDPTPRNRALLNLRALNSEKKVLGEYFAASPTSVMSALSRVFFDTAVTLTGSFCTSAGSFCALTVTGGIVTRFVGCAVVCEFVCASSCPRTDGMIQKKAAARRGIIQSLCTCRTRLPDVPVLPGVVFPHELD